MEKKTKTHEITPPPLRQTSHRARGARFILPILLVALGVGVAIGGAMRIVRIASSNGFRFEAPGETLINISKPGDYRLWVETRTIVDGAFRTSPNTMPPGSHIAVSRPSDGAGIELRMSGNMTMSVNGTTRVALAKMTFPEKGEYVVAVTGTDEKRFLYLDEASSVLDFFKAVGIAMLGGLIILGGAIWGIFRATQRTTG